MPRQTLPRLKSRRHRFLPDGPLDRRIAKALSSICNALSMDSELDKQSTQFEDLDYISEELLALLHRSHLFLRTTDSSASVAVQRANIEALLQLGRPLTDQDYRNLDGASQIRIGHHLEGGLISADSLNLNDASLRKAATEATKTLENISSGRPANTESLARMQLALGLAAIFSSATGMPPGRSVAMEAGSRGSTTPSREQGQFLAFVEAVVSKFPKPLRRRLNPVQLARNGAKLIKRHPDGLIPESKFLS